MTLEPHTDELQSLIDAINNAFPDEPRPKGKDLGLNHRDFWFGSLVNQYDKRVVSWKTITCREYTSHANLIIGSLPTPAFVHFLGGFLVSCLTSMENLDLHSGVIFQLSLVGKRGASNRANLPALTPDQLDCVKQFLQYESVHQTAEPLRSKASKALKSVMKAFA
jgi:hypothetical protein